MNMATVYLKGGKSIEVPLDELEGYLYNNADKIETRHIQRRRPPTEGAFTKTVTTNQV